MKKVICLLLVTISIICIAAPQQADAQVVYSRKCCDSNAVVRCVLENWTPVGNPCFCYGQGWGVTC